MQSRIIGELQLINTVIDFKNGENNIIFADNSNGPVILENSKIVFEGSNSLVYLKSGGDETLKFQAVLNFDDTLYIGANNSFHRSSSIHFVVGDMTNIIIGDDGLFSRNIYLRPSDAHVIYSTKTHARINFSKDIVIGDHVWIGQDVMILKGAHIGSGAIVGSKSLITSNALSSNSTYGGSPARLIGEQGGVFFTKQETHNLTKETAKAIIHYENDAYIFNADEGTPIFDSLLTFLHSTQNIELKIEYLQNIPLSKNRFAI